MDISLTLSWKRLCYFLLITNVMLSGYLMYRISYWLCHVGKYFPDQASKAASDNRSGYQLEKTERQLPVIWVDGLHRSGTTLMRVLLDTDPNINCGPEPKFFSSFLGYINNQIKRVSRFDIAKPMLFIKIISIIFCR